jgi:hypothetical protein
MRQRTTDSRFKTYDADYEAAIAAVRNAMGEERPDAVSDSVARGRPIPRHH